MWLMQYMVEGRSRLEPIRLVPKGVSITPTIYLPYLNYLSSRALGR